LNEKKPPRKLGGFLIRPLAKVLFATVVTEKNESHLQVYGKGLTRKAQIGRIFAKLNKKFASFAFSRNLR
jgi:hypothetical protein